LGTFFRAGRAGLLTALTFNKPGNVNSPTARFLMCRSINTASSSKTAETSFLLNDVLVAISLKISVLVNFFCIAGARLFATVATFRFAAFLVDFLTTMPALFINS
jgi:hypothetical protein